jgi:hypothetical protein
MTTDLDITKAIASAYKTMYEPKEEVVVEETPSPEPAAEQEEVVQEAKAKLDPVGKEDDDVDNDGDTDAADKYLKKRRQAISKAVKKEKTEKTQKEDIDLTDAVNRVITGQDETLEVEAASQNEVIEQGKDSVCEEKYLDQKGKGESDDGYHDAGMFSKAKASQLAKKHKGSKVVKDASGKYVVRLKEDLNEDYYAVQYYNKKGKPEESPATFKDERSAKKYHAKAMKAVKDGSYKMFKVKGRMESTKNEGNAFTKALAAAKLNGDDEFIVSGKKYRVEDYEGINEAAIKKVRGKDGKFYDLELGLKGRKVNVRTKNQFGDIETISIKQAAKLFELAVIDALAESDFEPHMMYDPKTGKGYKAEKPEDHERMKKLGYTHEKPEKVDEVEQPRAKGEKDFKDAHKVKRTAEGE